LQFKIDNDINLSDLDLLGHSPNCQEQGVGFPAPFLLSGRALAARISRQQSRAGVLRKQIRRHVARGADRDTSHRPKRLTTLSKIVGQMPLVTSE
jgi:hypothetical protein